MVQELLLDRAQTRIQKEFGWERYGDGEHTALFAEDTERFLDRRGLGWMVSDFVDLDRLNSLDTGEEVGTGHYSCVHQIEDTDIVAKRYFPFVYSGGYNGDNCLRRVSESSILRDLIVNLALEQALEGDEDYITPRYLGHLMLQGTQEEAKRHYTLMTKLDILDLDACHALPDEEQARDYQLRRQFKDHCLSALRSSDSRVMLSSFDINKHSSNMPLIFDEQTREMKLGVIDVETSAKWRRKVDRPLLAYSNTDVHAPWLATNKFGLDAGTEMSPAA
jgi:hypothetical protein